MLNETDNNDTVNRQIWTSAVEKQLWGGNKMKSYTGLIKKHIETIKTIMHSSIKNNSFF